MSGLPIWGCGAGWIWKFKSWFVLSLLAGLQKLQVQAALEGVWHAQNSRRSFHETIISSQMFSVFKPHFFFFFKPKRDRFPHFSGGEEQKGGSPAQAVWLTLQLRTRGQGLGPRSPLSQQSATLRPSIRRGRTGGKGCVFFAHLCVKKRESTAWKMDKAAVSTLPPTPGFMETQTSTQCPQKQTFFPPTSTVLPVHLVHFSGPL